MNIAVSGDDLSRIGASSIAIPGQKDSYIAGLSVYHELHCLVGNRCLHVVSGTSLIDVCTAKETN
jgi:hypothetical protein